MIPDLLYGTRWLKYSELQEESFAFRKRISFLKNAVLHYIAADLQEAIIDTAFHVACKDNKQISGSVHPLSTD